MIRIHGIDLGASCGIATLEQDGRLVAVRTITKPDVRKARAGKPATKKRPAVDPVDARPLWMTWAEHVAHVRAALLDLVKPGDVMAYEDVRRHSSTDAGHAYGRILGVVEEVAWIREATLVVVPVSRAKMCATGHGRAEKADMIAAALEKWGVECDEHQADSLFIAEVARRGEE